MVVVMTVQLVGMVLAATSSVVPIREKFVARTAPVMMVWQGMVLVHVRMDMLGACARCAAPGSVCGDIGS